MTLVETKYSGYFIDLDSFKVYSNKRKGKLRELKQSYVYDLRKRNSKPYIQVGVKGCTLLHRLIACTFIGNIEGKTVNHKDGNTLNNRVDNLEIVSALENIKHAKETGLIASGEKHGRSLYSDIFLKKVLLEIKKGSSVRSVSKKYGISTSYLNRVKNGVCRPYLRQIIFQEEL